MSQAAEARLPETAPAAGDDHLTHIACRICVPDIALCGKDMTGCPWLPWDGSPDDCVVCEDLALPHVESCEGRPGSGSATIRS